MSNQPQEYAKDAPSSHNTSYKYFGLFDFSSKSALPLRKVEVSAKIHDYIAEVTYSQLFFNPTKSRLEAEYFFPISNTACFHGFKAKFGNTTVEGVVKGKEEAKKAYNTHLQEGDLVAYAETVDNNCSVLCMRIGNLPPGSEIQIFFSYIERLEISMNKFWRFTLYSCLVSRVNHGASGRLDTSGTASTASESHRNNVLANYPGQSGTQGPKWNVNVEVESRTPIALIKSPSHDVDIKETQISGVFNAKVTFAKEYYTQNKDFVLLYATDSMNKPGYLLSPFEGGYCALINFFPEIHSYMSFDDAFLASLEGKDPLEQMISSAKHEFLFIIDRSNTMKGTRMELAKETLTNFLKILPPNNYFNILGILGIGDAFSLFTSQSIQTDENNIQEAINQVKGFVRSSGPPSVVKVFEHLEKSKPIPQHSRIVFLLTAGQVNMKTHEVVHMIKDKLFKTRVFVLGIGEGSATEFTKTTAFEGYGGFEVIRTSEEINDKVTHLLKLSVAPYFTDFELKIQNESLFSYIVPLPKVLGCISPNELVEFFVVFNKKLDTAKKTTFTLKFFNGYNQRTEEYKQDIDVDCADLSEAVVKLGMLKFCESLVKRKEVYEAMGSGEIINSFKEDVKKNLVKTAITHGLLTSETSFICVIREGDDIIRQMPAQKITMHAPLTESLIKGDPQNGIYKRRMGNSLNSMPLRDDSADMQDTSEIGSASGRKSTGPMKRSPVRPTLHNEGLERVRPMGKRSVNNIEEKPKEPLERERPDEGFNQVELNRANEERDSQLPEKQMPTRQPVDTTRQPVDIVTGYPDRHPMSKHPTLDPNNIALTVSGEIPHSLTKINNANNMVNGVNNMNTATGLSKMNTIGGPFGNYVPQTMSSMMGQSGDPNKPFGMMITKAYIENVERMSQRLNPGENIQPSTYPVHNYVEEPSVSRSVNSSRRGERKNNFMKLFACFAKKPVVKTITHDRENILSKLIAEQNHEGFWEPEGDVVEALGYSWSKLKKKLPMEIRRDRDKELIWLTLLILAWIEHTYPGTPQWERTGHKAEDWLKRKDDLGINHDLYEQAKRALGFA